MKKMLFISISLLILVPLGQCLAEKSKQDQLQSASTQGDSAASTKILNDGADPNGRDPFGRTPLFNAAWGGKDAVVALLLTHGAEINAKDRLGSTALHKAVQGGYQTTVSLLLAEGADINAQDNEGYAPLHEAARFDKTNIARFLLEKGANSDLKNKSQLTASDIAKQRNNTTLVELIKSTKAEAAQKRPLAQPGEASKKRKRDFSTVVKLLRAQTART